MKWAPNPYAIAQLLDDRIEIDSLSTETGKRVDDILRDVFLYGSKTDAVTKALTVFQRISEEVKGRVTLAEALNSEYIQGIQNTEPAYSTDKLRRVLPALLEISDDTFAGHVLADGSSLTSDNVSYSDPRQGAVGNCYFVSAMIALAWARPDALQSRLDAAGSDTHGEPSFKWKFETTDDGQLASGEATVSRKVPMAGKLPRYCHSTTRDEYWPALVEKAYVVRRRVSGAGDLEPTPADYQAINANRTHPQYACQALVGGSAYVEVYMASELPNSGLSRLFRPGGALHESSGVMSRPVMASTIADMGPSNSANWDIWERTGIWPNHAYAVLGAMQGGQVVLRNPHGMPTEMRTGYERGPWTAGSLSVNLNENGVFAIADQLFNKIFKDICWVEVD